MIKRQPNGLIMYCATPSRLKPLEDIIERRASDEGYSPYSPFPSAPFKHFEGNPAVGRKKTLQFMKHIIAGCDLIGLFGISPGTMEEARFTLDFLGPEAIRTFPDFDPLWDEEYEKLKKTTRFGDILAEVRGPHNLYTLVGGRAVGKTHWSEIAIAKLGLRRVKNTTTRLPRNDADYDSYFFVSRPDFEEKIAAGELLEYVEQESQYYGSSLPEIKKVLAGSHGIMAITPEGASALWRYRYEINLRYIVLKASEKLLLENMVRRGITDQSKQSELMAAHETFILPPHIPHEVVRLDGGANDERILELLAR